MSTTHPIPEGARVRVVTVSESANHEFRERVVGREGIYVRYSEAATGSPHIVEFWPGPDGGPDVDQRYVMGVEYVGPPAEPDADDAAVGMYYATDSPYDTIDQTEAYHRCLEQVPGTLTWMCSRPAGHMGQHVAAEGHAGRIMATAPWEAAKPKPKPEPEPKPAPEVTDWAYRYEALAQALVELAKSERWCEEFDDVMRGAGFEDILAQRAVEYDVTIRITYTLDASSLDRILHTEFGGEHDVQDDVDVVSDVQVRTSLTGKDPDDLDHEAVSILLNDKGYDVSRYADAEVTTWDIAWG